MLGVNSFAYSIKESANGFLLYPEKAEMDLDYS